MKLSREFKTAIIVIAGIAFFFIGFNFLKSRSIFSPSNTYYAYFEHSNGLKSGTPITINGVKIGAVESVKLDEQTTKIKVTMDCSVNYSFSKNSKAEIYNSLLGGAGLQIVPVFDDAPLAESGDTLASSVQMDMMRSLASKIEPISQNAETLLLNLDTAVKSVNTILDPTTISEMKKTITNLNIAMQNLAQSSVALNQLLAKNKAHLEATLQNSDNITANLAKFSDDLAKSDVSKLMLQTQEALTGVNEILADIQAGKGSFGKLMKDESLYKNLDASSKQLELLLQDFRLNPKRYVHFSVFGKKAKVYEAPETEKTEN